ncbi:MAG: hypothetical protein M3142_03550 [Bacteroidota bacterium]|nr:hypothetical protein [Bacteroidota bacterium]
MERMQALEEKVLAIHDEAMSRMDAAYELRMNLQKLNQRLITQPTHSTITGIIKNQYNLLNLAEEAMMDWMHQYKVPEKSSPQQAIIYLENQLAKINQVKTQMNSALETAQKTYQQYEKL